MHPFTQHDVPDGAAAVHWFEQSSFAVRDAAGTLTLVDPYSPHDRPADRFIHAKPPMDEAEWPAHFVLLTHAHGDHTNPETLARLHAGTSDARYLGPQEAIDQLVEETPIAPAQCTAVSAGDRVQIGTMALNVVYAKPPDGDPNAGIEPPDTPHLGYVVEAGQHRLYFTGDPINTFAEHESLTAPVAALQPTVAFLTNHPTEGEFPYFDGCVRMATRCRVGIACPAHYACFVARNYDPAEVGRRLPGWRTVDPHHPAQLERRLRGVTAQAVLVEEALADGRLRLPSPTAPSFVDLVNAIHRGAGVPVAPTPHSGELGEHLFDRDHLVIVLVDGMGMAALDDSGVCRPAQPRVQGARLRVSGDDRLRHHDRRDRPLARTPRCPGMVRIPGRTRSVRHGAAVHRTRLRSRPGADSACSSGSSGPNRHGSGR